MLNVDVVTIASETRNPCLIAKVLINGTNDVTVIAVRAGKIMLGVELVVVVQKMGCINSDVLCGRKFRYLYLVRVVLGAGMCLTGAGLKPAWLRPRDELTEVWKLRVGKLCAWTGTWGTMCAAIAALLLFGSGGDACEGRELC